MTTLFEDKGLQAQALKVESMVTAIIAELKNRYGVPVPKLAVVWDKGDPRPFSTCARVENNNLYLSWTDLVFIPYNRARRDTPVSLELNTPDGKMCLTFPYHKILDWLIPPPKIQIALGAPGSTPMTDPEMKREIAGAIVSHVLEQLDGWLTTDHANIRCLRNGIVSVYGHLMAGTMPTQVSERIWETDDPGLEKWRESEGGFFVLYPYLKDYLYTEVLGCLKNANPPNAGERLPEYITRTLQSL
jgi:hypothetical protein